jgi:hypothetical protein
MRSVKDVDWEAESQPLARPRAIRMPHEFALPEAVIIAIGLVVLAALLG